jgi:hypothetical protein
MLRSTPLLTQRSAAAAALGAVSRSAVAAIRTRTTAAHSHLVASVSEAARAPLSFSHFATSQNTEGRGRATAAQCFSTNSSASSASSAAVPSSSPIEYSVVPKSDHGAYKEYSVIHTDRSLNLMSAPFGTVMRDLNNVMKHTYQAAATVILPGYVSLAYHIIA